MPKPPLPASFDLPVSVNGWDYRPSAPSNGHVWVGGVRPASVSVFSSLGTVRVTVSDDRVSGFASSVELYRDEYAGGDTMLERLTVDEAGAVRDGVEYAIEWMGATPPEEWSHPEVTEAVFDPPPGYRLAEYYLEDRQTTVYYLRSGAEGVRRLAGGGAPDEYTPETCPYLYVHIWNGSGTATVALAPWIGAHGPGSKYPEIEPVVDCPDECGLDVALTCAREWARENVAEESPGDRSTSANQPVTGGQAALSAFGGGKV